MRQAMMTLSGSAALVQMAWPSSIPSASVSLTSLLRSRGSCSQADRSVAAVAPGLAAVGRAHHAADFEHGVDLVGRAGCARKPHDTAVERHLGVVRQARVGRGSSSRRRRCCDKPRPASRRQHAFRIGRIGQERPDLHTLVWKIRALKGGAMIGAAIDAVVGPGEHQIRIARMHEDGEGFEVLQHIVPVGGRGCRGETRRPCRFCPWCRNNRRRRQTRRTEPWRSPPGFWAMIFGWRPGRKGSGDQ